ncbi:MAG: MerR family transcriptional regulator, partial [Rhodobacteraceae bacterium]|nr:MerR family transcriptional regulator [Paracoccaceae bacterium]
MKYSVRTITHEYSPSEVARVSGVSTSLQRDWRRRGVIQGRADGWNKYDLADVIRMTVMRAFTQSGISLETAESVSSLAVLPVMDELVRWD